MTVVCGAITGVGIWWTIGLASPLATETLIHIFVFGWAMEYIAFILEITSGFMFFYFWGRPDEKTHVRMAWMYAVWAWISLFGGGTARRIPVQHCPAPAGRHELWGGEINMDPKMLIGPSIPMGFPAPFWFLMAFKVLGFTLHMAPIHVWFSGILLSMWMRGRGGRPRPAARNPAHEAEAPHHGLWGELRHLPLLFTQVVYHRVFYPDTILMAWPWFSIVILPTFAYYGVYVYSLELWKSSPRAYLKDYIGWAAAGLFLVIGFIFSSSFSLMTNAGAWPETWQKTSVAGAPLGIGHNLGDPTLLPRWLMMFGLALTTTAAYIVLDTAYFAIGEKPEYKQWAGGFAPRLCALGVIWFMVAGVWYYLSWTPET
ncbi:MAG: hypothetical protein IT210_09075 [Armatimonadetes bacterium]|nr:hypothetical protein [Armatimonadota bacterium]